jgi:hypothetical protein
MKCILLQKDKQFHKKLTVSLLENVNGACRNLVKIYIFLILYFLFTDPNTQW